MPIRFSYKSHTYYFPLIISILLHFFSQFCPSCPFLWFQEYLVSFFAVINRNFIYKNVPFYLISELCQLNFHLILLSCFFCKPVYSLFELLCQEVIFPSFLWYPGIMLIHSCNLLYDVICVLYSLHLAFDFIFLPLCRLGGTISIYFFFLLIWMLTVYSCDKLLFDVSWKRGKENSGGLTDSFCFSL